MTRAISAEFFGSLLLAAAVIGSGIMAERLAGGNPGIALLANTAATVAALSVLIAVLAPSSGAHFNPAVTLVAWFNGDLGAGKAFGYLCAQVAGCCSGAWLAHAMFAMPIFEASSHVRTGVGQWISEVVATAGLILVAFSAPSIKEAAWRVPAWIGAAYWFTASTSFANPAITLGRALTDSFAGIRPADVPGFVLAQLAGAALGALAFRALRERA